MGNYGTCFVSASTLLFMSHTTSSNSSPLPGGGRAGNYVSILNIVTIRNYGLPLEMSGVRDVEYTELYIPVYW